MPVTQQKCKMLGEILKKQATFPRFDRFDLFKKDQSLR